MLEKILSLDSLVTSSIARLFPHNIFFDTIFSFLSLNGNFLFIWVFILLFLFFKERRKDKLVFVYFALSLVITLLAANFLKDIFDRPRPWTLIPPEDVRCMESNFSFPSGHAAGAMSGAVILAAYNKKRKYLYYVIAALISLSRIYWQCHYLLDIIFGASLGFLVSYLILKITTHSIDTAKDTKK